MTFTKGDGLMEEITRKAWALYRSAFKDGEQVVVEDDSGNYLWGKLKTDNNGITLTRRGGDYDYLFWDEIVFMAHDGFPVRDIMGMTMEQAEMLAGLKPTAAVRKLMQELVYEKSVINIGGGCPFEIGPCCVDAIHNPGHNGPDWWGWDGEETLVLRSLDGAIMHSFDLSHIFHLEVSQ